MRLLRWTERIHQYNYDVVYRPGKENCVADMLSRSINMNEETHRDGANDTRADENFINTIFGLTSLRAINQEEIAVATKDYNQFKLVRILIKNGSGKTKPNSPERGGF